VDIDKKIIDILSGIPGFVSIFKLDHKYSQEILRLEKENEHLPNKIFTCENQGIIEALSRGNKYAIAYYPKFFEIAETNRKKTKVNQNSENESFGLKICEPSRIKGKLSNFKENKLKSPTFLNIQQIHIDKKKAKLLVPEKSFHLLEIIKDIRNIISGSPSPNVDYVLKQKMGINISDTQIGTIIIGFTISKS
jgi:hypothetical protein